MIPWNYFTITIANMLFLKLGYNINYKYIHYAILMIKEVRILIIRGLL